MVNLLSSLPAWGEWIEINLASAIVALGNSLSPHGESGLKFSFFRGFAVDPPSLPAWGEWIEIIRIKKY